MAVTSQLWKNRRVLVTGHTGFKGTWLTLWLRRLGATVTGYSLAPSSGPNLFELTEAAQDADSIFADVRDTDALQDAMSAARPEVVFHLAAQSLVRESYSRPLETLSTNIMGTAHVLEAIRRVDSVRAVVIVTSDKCYENREHRAPYRETDAMGGHDPYSASKGAAEIVTSAYRRSFFSSPQSPAVASVRAGNVIGGGDFAVDRLIPDCVRAAKRGQPVLLRHPHSTRPWQFVLEPLSGYLALSERLFTDGHAFAEAWNFGPSQQVLRTVGWLCEGFARALQESGVTLSVEKSVSESGLHEATLLQLDSAKAGARLGWHPVLSLDDSLDMTASWYVSYFRGEGMRACTLSQIAAFESRINASR